MKFQLKRVYEKADVADGYRVLVDRLWPRGLSKEKARVDLWLKDIAPSTELRKWFGHDPEKWNVFQQKYKAELKEKNETVKILKEEMKKHSVTLVYAAKDELHNDALVLKEFLEGSK